VPLDVPKSPAVPPGEEDLIALLQEVLVDTSASNTKILWCDRVHHRQRDGLRGTTQYHVDLQDADGASASRVLVTTLSLGGNRTQRLWNQLVKSGRAAIVDASGLRAFAYVPDLDLLVQVFPHDARLPALAQMVPAPSPALVAVLDQDRARTLPGNGAWAGESVRYRPEMRATVQLDDRSPDERGQPTGVRYFAKVYREPAQAQQAAVIQAALFHAVDAGSPPLQVARPVSLDPALNTLLTSAVSGASLEQKLGSEGDFGHALRETARALADLHALPVQAPARPTTMELDHARQAGEVIVEANPDLAPLVREILDPVADALQDAPLSFIHGDLKPEHVVSDEATGRISILDFDLCATADPILDVAHFLAFLGKPTSNRSAQSRQDPNPGQVFLDAYFAHARDEGRARIASYHAITALHRAAGLCRSRGDDAGEQVSAVLEEGLRYLTGAVDVTVIPTFKRRMTRTI
jgi:hypothetical protein